MVERDEFDRFDDYGDIYELTSYPRLIPEHVILKILFSTKGQILDAGTADGTKLQFLLPKLEVSNIDHIHAIDPSPLYEEARNLFAGIDYISIEHSSLYDIDSNRSFDTIYLFEVIEHVEDPERCLAHLKSILKQDGTLIVSTPNKWVYHLTEWIGGGEVDPTHVSEMHSWEFIRLMNKQFDRTQFYGVLPIMSLVRVYPPLSFLNRWLSFLHISRTIYCFAKK